MAMLASTFKCTIAQWLWGLLIYLFFIDVKAAMKSQSTINLQNLHFYVHFMRISLINYLSVNSDK